MDGWMMYKVVITQRARVMGSGGGGGN